MKTTVTINRQALNKLIQSFYEKLGDIEIRYNIKEEAMGHEWHPFLESVDIIFDSEGQ